MSHHGDVFIVTMEFSDGNKDYNVNEIMRGSQQAPPPVVQEPQPPPPTAPRGIIINSI